ncbi:hypothetical protein HT746_20105 [Burkholderia pyrrocinia]|uniref:hypothetical protein n=1 Tax=Burkholderia pyrrocinia TaxID=60550 RepID=UPI0015754E07|nr:hypothetical protein [Burkholderia pyrrocinia]NTX29397.1 hypothetical protein [Burkholderia pyrrocinia]
MLLDLAHAIDHFLAGAFQVVPQCFLRLSCLPGRQRIQNLETFLPERILVWHRGSSTQHMFAKCENATGPLRAFDDAVVGAVM